MAFSRPLAELELLAGVTTAKAEKASRSRVVDEGPSSKDASRIQLATKLKANKPLKLFKPVNKGQPKPAKAAKPNAR